MSESVENPATEQIPNCKFKVRRTVWQAVWNTRGSTQNPEKQSQVWIQQKNHGWEFYDDEGVQASQRAAGIVEVL